MKRQYLINGFVIYLLTVCGCTRAPELTKFHPPVFVRIPAGSFISGDPSDAMSLPGKQRSMPVYYMTRNEITVEQYINYANDQHLMLTNHPQVQTVGSHNQSKKGWEKEPVTHVSFDDAEQYSIWLSEKMDKTVALPTEYEWEYAARAGFAQAPYPWGWGSPAGRAVWQTSSAHPVGEYSPNGFDLFDMSGNVSEWCVSDAAINERGGVVRGGAWSETMPEYLTVYKRIILPEEYHGADVGFRVVLRTDGKK